MLALSSNALSHGHTSFADGGQLANETVRWPSIPVSWHDIEYRHAAVEAEVAHGIAWQVRVNREERGMTQAELAKAVGTKQSAVSKLEDPEGGDVRLSTLVKVAHGLDCALLVRFVSHSTLLAFTEDTRPERLFVFPFEEECAARGLHGFAKNVLAGESA